MQNKILWVTTWIFPFSHLISAIPYFWLVKSLHAVMRIEITDSWSCRARGIQKERLITLFGTIQNIAVAKMAGVWHFTSHFAIILLKNIAFASTVTSLYIHFTTLNYESNSWQVHWNRQWRELSHIACVWEELRISHGTQATRWWKWRKWNFSLWDYMFSALSACPRHRRLFADSLNLNQVEEQEDGAIFIVYRNRSWISMTKYWNKRNQSIAWSSPYHPMKTPIIDSYHRTRGIAHWIIGRENLKLGSYRIFAWMRNSYGSGVSVGAAIKMMTYYR